MYEFAKYIVVYFCFFMIIRLISSGITALIDWCRKKGKAHKNPKSEEKSE